MTTNTTTDALKTQLLDALRVWINQRPGLEFGNYGDAASYRSELRSIRRDLHDARQLLTAVSASTISGEVLRDTFPHAFSGRLTWTGERLDYCTGQYWPTEYRKAACAVLASALWNYYRDDFAAAAKPGESAGDAVRRMFRVRFGRGLASRWFN